MRQVFSAARMHARAGKGGKGGKIPVRGQVDATGRVFFNLSNVLPGGRRDARRLREASELTMTCPAVPSPEPGRIDRLIRKWRRGRYAVAASFIA